MTWLFFLFPHLESKTLNANALKQTFWNLSFHPNDSPDSSPQILVAPLLSPSTPNGFLKPFPKRCSPGARYPAEGR